MVAGVNASAATSANPQYNLIAVSFVWKKTTILAGKGDRHLLPERPFGCFAQKVPVPFSPFPLFPASLESAKMRSSALPTEMLCSAQKPAQFPRMLLLNASRHSQQLPPPGVNAGPKPEEKRGQAPFAGTALDQPSAGARLRTKVACPLFHSANRKAPCFSRQERKDYY